MADFIYFENPLTTTWTVLAPRRAKRPDAGKGTVSLCPFCPGREKEEEEVYRVPHGQDSHSDTWLVRVIPNKFPFSQYHEVIIHSPDHHKNFGELPLMQVEKLLSVYRQRYNTYKKKGQVYLFHNRGAGGGESLPHPHSQLVVVPFEVRMQIPPLDPNSPMGYAPKPITTQSIGEEKRETVECVTTPLFYLTCPMTSQWPDEVYIIPQKRLQLFGDSTDAQIEDLAKILTRLIEIMQLRHGMEFPYNFYIYPGMDWYLRFIPRDKSLGGFEVGTGIFINTQDPRETIGFLKEHFSKPNKEVITVKQQADYRKHV